MISNDGVSKADDNHEVEFPEMFDSYINMEFILPRVNDGELYHATIKVRAINDDGKPLGVETYNPITGTRPYEVEYIDGTVKTVGTNVIDENLLSRVNQEGHRQILINEIINHRKTTESIDQRDASLINPQWKPQAARDHKSVVNMCPIKERPQ